MDGRLTRRRFARLALASGVAASSIGLVAVPTTAIGLARTQYSGLLGITGGARPNGGNDVPEVNRTEVDNGNGNSAAASNTAVPIGLVALNLATGQTRPLASSPATIRAKESVTGSAVLGDGTVVLAATDELSAGGPSTSTRLVQLGASPSTVPVAGLAANEQLGDLLATADGRLLGLVTQRSGAVPATLVEIDPQRGRLTPLMSLQLPGYWRIATLLQSPEGQLQATAVTRDGETHLVNLTQAQGSGGPSLRLSAQGQVWNNGLQNLVYSSTGELIAFGALRYETSNALYLVNRTTGDMTRLFDLGVVSVAFSRA